MKSLSPALALIAAILPVSAMAGSSMAIWAGESGTLISDLSTPTDRPFDVVVTLNSDGHNAQAAEFVMTDLRLEFPGVLAIATTKINDTALDLGYNDAGEYLMAFGACEPSGTQIELVRVTYADFSGVIGSTSIVMKLRGFQSGDSQPSTFNGQPGFVDCALDAYDAPMGGNSADGTLCINCYLPPATEASMSEMKSRF